MGTFLNNKYYHWYTRLIDNANNRILGGYVERHHIIPRSMGGVDDKSNIALLTAREHYIAHLLLTKFTYGQDKSKMFRALVRLSVHTKTSRKFAWLREYISKNSFGANNPAYGRFWAHNNIGDIAFVKELPASWTRGLPYQRGGNPLGSRWINDGATETMISGSTKIPDGWEQGRVYRPSTSSMQYKAKLRHTAEKDIDHGNKIRGRISIERDGIFKRISPEDLTTWTSLGWNKRGNIVRHSRKVIIDGIEYETIGRAAQSLNLHVNTVTYRAKSSNPRWKDWNISN